MDEKSELLLTILSTIAQEEARNVSENVKWGNRKLIERGKYNLPAHRFYGYNTDEKGEWVIDEEQAAVITFFQEDLIIMPLEPLEVF